MVLSPDFRACKHSTLLRNRINVLFFVIRSYVSVLLLYICSFSFIMILLPIQFLFFLLALFLWSHCKSPKRITICRLWRWFIACTILCINRCMLSSRLHRKLLSERFPYCSIWHISDWFAYVFESIPTDSLVSYSHGERNVHISQHIRRSWTDAKMRCKNYARAIQ